MVLTGDGAAVGRDRWPWWHGLVGFVLALSTAGVLAGFISGAFTVLDATGHRSDHAATLLSVAAQDVVLIATAAFFAGLTARPRPASFGLIALPGRTLWRSVGVAGGTFLLVSILWSLIAGAEGEQDTLELLGADEGIAFLVLAAAFVIVAAPFAEELFFRGFLFPALRNRFGVTPAITADAVIFGLIHYAGADTVPLLPLLAVFGATLCLLYQRTGSLWPAIVLHAINNAIAFTASLGSDDAAVASVAGLVVVVALWARFGRTTA